MLRFKIKEILLAMDKRKPHAWLMKNCHFRSTKAHNFLNSNQKSISLKDLGKLCVMLNCSPNDLFWWENLSRTKLPPTHPLNTKLEPPSKKPLWTEEIQDLNTEQMRLVRDFLHDVKNQNKVDEPENDQEPLSPV